MRYDPLQSRTLLFVPVGVIRTCFAAVLVPILVLIFAPIFVSIHVITGFIIPDTIRFVFVPILIVIVFIFIPFFLVELIE